MSQLAQLQANFQAYLIDENHGDEFKKNIVDDAKVGVKKRLSIYADAYRLRIIEALSNSYPKLKALLGDDLFDTTARTYIDAYPSKYRNMRWVGDQMATHLADTLSQHPIAAEMASFEWALGLAFDAEDLPVLKMQDLALIAPENWADLALKFDPSVQLLTLKWNVLLVWQALDLNINPPAPVLINQACLIWRQETNSHYQSLDKTELYAVQMVLKGSSFGILCDHLHGSFSDEEAITKAAGFLNGWLIRNMLSAST